MILLFIWYKMCCINVEKENFLGKFVLFRVNMFNIVFFV